MVDQTVKIVELPASEWRIYRELRLLALQESPQAFSSRYDDQRELGEDFWRSRLQKASYGESSWLFFACYDNRLVGMIGAFRDGDNDNDAELVSMYVVPEMRGRGVARTLLHSILTVIQERGVCVARLSVNMQQLPALQLYQSLGFQIVKVEPAVMGDGTIYDEALMVKNL